MTPLYLYNGKLLVKDGALAVGGGCCCGGCDCCRTPSDSFQTVALAGCDDWSCGAAIQSSFYENFSASTEGGYFFGGYFIKRKPDAPTRSCPVVAWRVGREASRQLVFIRSQSRFRFLTMDCSAKRWIDVTSDYEEPSPIPPEDERIGYWTFSGGAYKEFPDETPTEGDLPPWPDFPTCDCQQCASLNTGCCRYVEITLSGSYDSDGTYQAQLPTYGMQNRDGRPQERGCFEFIGAVCGPYGPNGEYGWLLSPSVCGSCDPENRTAAWEGFVPLVTDDKGWCCAKTGTVEMTPVMLWGGSADTHGMSITVTVQPGVVISAVGTSGTDFPCSRAYCTDYPNQCPTIGVCCDQFDQATPSTEADCAARGGTFHADGTYDPSMPCVEGLCCMPWGRFPSSAAACGNLGGVFHPNGTFNPANPPC